MRNGPGLLAVGLTSAALTLFLATSVLAQRAEDNCTEQGYQTVDLSNFIGTRGMPQTLVTVYGDANKYVDWSAMVSYFRDPKNRAQLGRKHYLWRECQAWHTQPDSAPYLRSVCTPCAVAQDYQAYVARHGGGGNGSGSGSGSGSGNGCPPPKHYWLGQCVN